MTTKISQSCAIRDCDSFVAGNSKYCAAHRAIARTKFFQMVLDQKIARLERSKKFEAEWTEAYAIALKAGQDVVPTPMVVQGHVDPFDDSSHVNFEEVVPGGPCGHAWVAIKPGNCAFANWAKKKKLGEYSSYSKSVLLWASEFGQSHDRKVAFARILARELKSRICQLDARIYSHSRLD